MVLYQEWVGGSRKWRSFPIICGNLGMDVTHMRFKKRGILMMLNYFRLPSLQLTLFINLMFCNWFIIVGKNQNKDLRIDIKVLEENIDATQRQLSKLYISQQNISMLTKKVEQLQKQKGDLVKTMEKMARNNTFLSKENRRLKSKGVCFKFT